MLCVGSVVRTAQVLEVEFAALEDKKLRSQLKNPQDIEAQTTALQIASLRRIGSSTKVVLLDRYGPQAEAVAKELSKKGYGKVREPAYFVHWEAWGQRGGLGEPRQGEGKWIICVVRCCG